jgi:hypothetical protein
MEGKKIISFNNKIKSIIIIGPTAIGKTKISLNLANKLNGEIVNTDAFAFYKNADIMVAKANKKEKKLINHHLLDFLDIDFNDFSVFDFDNLYKNTIKIIKKKSKIPIVVGGSNYYLEYILFDKRLENEEIKNKIIRKDQNLFINIDILNDKIKEIKSKLKDKYENLFTENVENELIKKGFENKIDLNFNKKDFKTNLKKKSTKEFYDKVGNRNLNKIIEFLDLLLSEYSIFLKANEINFKSSINNNKMRVIIKKNIRI